MDNQPASEAGSKPGKVRTWWHPLLAALLRWQLGGYYKLEEEVPVGQKPLQIDVLLLRQEEGELPERARAILAGLAEYLNEFTLLELKSPSDTLRAGDFQTFLAYALLYRAQNSPLLLPERMNLLVLAPRLTAPYREEMRLLGVTPRQERPGVWALEGGPVIHRTWLLETGALAGPDHPLLTLFSPELLAEGPQTYQLLQQAGYADLVIYVAQQIQQFQQEGVKFAMQHLGTEDEMKKAIRDLFAAMPLEERLAGLTPEQILQWQAMPDVLAAMPPEKRLAGLTPEQILRGLTPEELEQLRKLLRVSEDKGNSSGSK